MVEKVNPEDIEAIFGVPRFPTWHLGLADPHSEVFYIMHSQECLDTNKSVLECKFSHVLDDDGISEEYWADCQGVPYFIILSPKTNRILPVWEAGLTEMGPNGLSADREAPVEDETNTTEDYS
jgi:hypothetical protein